MNEEFESVGMRITERMNILGLKQVNIINTTGISKTAISNYVNGNRIPDTMSIYKLSKILKVSIEWLLTGTQMKTERNDSEPLSEMENDIISMFRQLDERDQEDTFDSIKLKYDRMLKKGKQTSLYSTYTEEKESKKGNESDTSNNNSDIA